ncbi:MAG: hypothetical protein JWN36_241, partial [Microbacteriaceae bacterium]|nr:hypothetical protein [Microbacteriaceae bacterium]
MRIFISHTSYDHPVASYLSSALTGIGVKTFMLPEDAPAGSNWMEQIRVG